MNFRTRMLFAYTKDNKFINKFNTISEAAKHFNIKVNNISEACNGHRKSAYGFIWKWEYVNFQSLDNEEWKLCNEFDNKYAVSNKGRVVSLQFHNVEDVRLLSASNSNGYKQVKIRLWDKNINKCVKIHLLVAKHFIPNPDNKPCIDHIDTNTFNNNVENLRWVTPKENTHNPITLKRILKVCNNNLKHEKKPYKNSKQIIIIELNTNTKREFTHMAEAAIYYHLHLSTIKNVCERKNHIYKNKLSITYKEN